MFSSNQTFSSVNSSYASLQIDEWNAVQQRFINQLPLVITILGLIGFIGNFFTFLQPALRNNSFCIYTLLASFVDIINLFVNLFPLYLNPSAGNLTATITNGLICKLKIFGLMFLPQLSLNLLILSLIDRYACTFGPTTRLYQLLQLRTVPRLVLITVIITCVLSFFSPLMYDVIPGFGCVTKYTIANPMIYTVVHGIVTPTTMLIFVFLTYRRFVQRRGRIGVVVVTNKDRRRNQFIGTVFTQVFVSSFFVWLWTGTYWYFLTIQNSKRSAEEWAIVNFLLSLTNNLYYLINVRSFYLSTLTSRLFRETMVASFLKLLRRNFH
ncbi:unnamed protein product [Adineta ricciae]|uniref:G-protein coupled receptors family 1 profile domain-containing protein n=1 Tax=Adineta ricciae TaxID=249248 RepID=A0A815T819_ADIRI|nr:unnamed protein product [Adineta ricciae]CAF1499555.1 unnamed protein product [Adineta ricciae]